MFPVVIPFLIEEEEGKGFEPAPTWLRVAFLVILGLMIATIVNYGIHLHRWYEAQDKMTQAKIEQLERAKFINVQRIQEIQQQSLDKIK